MDTSTALMWFRRDLRTTDNTALFHALQNYPRVYCVFVLDSNILAALPDDDRRLAFIHAALHDLHQALLQNGGGLHVVFGDPLAEIPRFAAAFDCSAVYCNRDYEPYARKRDAQVAATLAASGISFHASKDQVIFECDELLTGQGKPYTVFTPYMKTWRQRFSPVLAQPCPAPLNGAIAAVTEPYQLPSLQDIGFARASIADLPLPVGRIGAESLLHDFAKRLKHYKTARDFPAIKGVSYLSAHLRFGTLSIREAVSLALQEDSDGADCWLNELIWREFYQQLLWHFPHVAEGSFKEQYRGLVFPGKEEWFAAWCEGLTGYPIVDAAMRQLNHSGYMHNRLRMIVASFLVKDLLIDWRRGEAYFAAKLLDFDLAANNGGWQWAASTGCDAQPYFRIFNPVSQSERFDPEGKFIRRYVPELAALDNKAIHAPWQAKQLPAGFALGRDYPLPIVDHAEQRELALALFGRK